MARSQETSQQIARSRAPVVAAETTAESTESVDVAAVVQQVMHSSFGNALVNAALNGADTSALGKALAGELAAATQGLGAMASSGVGLAAAGNSAIARVLGQGGGVQAEAMSEAAAVNQLRGGQGQALPDSVRSRMEGAFGRNFANVRVHVGGQTDAATEALGAQAVAMGSHIHFADGQFTPGTTAGDAVIAHELTHVVQAAEGRLPGTGGVSNTSMAAEQEAYGNESLARATGEILGSEAVGIGGPGDGLTQSSLEGVQFASSVDTTMAPSSLMPAGMSMGSLPSLGLGMSFGSSGPMSSIGSGMAPMGIASLGPAAAAPAAAASSAPAMLREDPTKKEAARETDSEAKIRHELAMGMNLGFRRAVDASENTASVAKEGSGRVDGVFHGPAKAGHLAVEEYMGVMREIGPDGKQTRSPSEDHIRDSESQKKGENDGHTHLDGDHRIGATPETTATPPGGDPVLGGSTGATKGSSAPAAPEGGGGAAPGRGKPGL